jgi:hypothetical protein
MRREERGKSKINKSINQQINKSTNQKSTNRKIEK